MSEKISINTYYPETYFEKITKPKEPKNGAKKSKETQPSTTENNYKLIFGGKHLGIEFNADQVQKITNAFNELYQLIEEKCKTDLNTLSQSCHVQPITVGLSHKAEVGNKKIFSIDTPLDFEKLFLAIYNNSTYTIEDQIDFALQFDQAIKSRQKKEKILTAKK